MPKTYITAEGSGRGSKQQEIEELRESEGSWIDQCHQDGCSLQVDGSFAYCTDHLAAVRALGEAAYERYRASSKLGEGNDGSV